MRKQAFFWYSTRHFCMKTCARFIVAGDKIVHKSIVVQQHNCIADRNVWLNKTHTECTVVSTATTWGNKHSFDTAPGTSVWRLVPVSLLLATKLSIKALLCNNIIVLLTETCGSTKHTQNALLFPLQRRLGERAKILRYTYSASSFEYELLIRNCKEFESECVCCNVRQVCAKVKNRRRSDHSSVIISIHTITKPNRVCCIHTCNF